MPVRTGAVVTVRGAYDFSPVTIAKGASWEVAFQPDFKWETPSVLWDVVGRSVLLRFCDRLRDANVERITLIPDVETTGQRISSVDTLLHAVIADQVYSGVDLILLTKVGTYFDLEISDVLRSHEMSSAPLTRAFSGNFPLDFVVATASCLRSESAPLQFRLDSLMQKSSRYSIRGYLNPLHAPTDFRRLTYDAINGRCTLTPDGMHIGGGVWLGSGAKVNSTVEISGPAYIGRNARVRRFCRITGGTSIEQDCDVDEGTLVDGCSVMAGTYLGMGLNLCKAVVGQGKLFHIPRGVEVDPNDGRIIGRAFAHRTLLRNISTLFSPPATQFRHLTTH